MGLFPLDASISSMLNPPRVTAVRRRWPGNRWSHCASAMHTCKSINASLLSDSPPSTTFRSLFSIRVNGSRLAGFASGCIQRTRLSRIKSRIASALQRWMHPMVERGPPFALPG
jgi:hypothetical protein